LQLITFSDSPGRGIGPSHRPLPAQHTTNTREKYPHTRGDSNRQSQQASLTWRGHRDRLIKILSLENIQRKPMTFTKDLGRVQDFSSRLEPRMFENDVRCELIATSQCFSTFRLLFITVWISSTEKARKMSHKNRIQTDNALIEMLTAVHMVYFAPCMKAEVNEAITRNKNYQWA